MTRVELERASEHVESAGQTTDDADASDRLEDVADQLTTLAEREQGPDHGRLARLQTALDEVQSEVSNDVAATIQSARDEISAYRETIEGV